MAKFECRMWLMRGAPKARACLDAFAGVPSAKASRNSPEMPPNKKAGSRAGLDDPFADRSVFGDDRAAEAIVHADSAQIDILADAQGRAYAAADRRQRDVAVVQEDVVVFEADRPVRREAELDTGADRAAPAGFAA